MAKMKKKTHGGKRPNSGRKPVADKKVTVSIYPQQSRINILGADTLKDIAIQAIEKEYKRNVKGIEKNLEKDLVVSK